MNQATLRRFSALALFVTVFVAAPSYAKRRAVAHRSKPVSITKTVSGTVLDAVTGQPVISLTVTIGTRLDITDNQGKFEIRNAVGEGQLVVNLDRSGYQPRVIRLNPGDNGVLGAIMLTPTPTATLRKTDGTVIQLDVESMKFGYGVPFSGYREDTFDEFCVLSDSTKKTIDRLQMAKLTGPAQITPAGSCCTGNAEKVNLALKNGEVLDVVFMDTCQEQYKIDVGARNHTTGQFVYTPVREIAEIVFP
jgi:hypothetical protein